MTSLNKYYRIGRPDDGSIILQHKTSIRKTARFHRKLSWFYMILMLHRIPRYLRPQVVRVLVEEWVYPVEEGTENADENNTD